jgi:protein-export membrane protein SecD
MLHFSRWKVIAIVVACLVGFIVALPNFFSKETVAGWPNFMPKRQVPLGLDLQGGAHLLLAMDTEELRRDWLGTLRDDARRVLREAKIPASTAVGANAVQVRLTRPEDTEAAMRELRKIAQPIGSAILGSTGTDVEIETTEPGVVVIRPTEAGLQQRITHAASAAIETVNRRVNNLGTAESTVVRQGRDRILVQFPGLQDTRQLKDLIGQTARLSFHAVHPTISAAEAQQTRVPAGYRIYESLEGQGGYVLQETPVVVGEDLVDAQPGFDQRTNEPIISFRFNQSGARKFGKFTQENVGAPFAIVLDNGKLPDGTRDVKVISAPVIREPILGGSGQISGNFTVETASNLAIQLRSGALPVNLTIVEERSVGPSLGADSIEAGKLAAIVGSIATVIMTVTAYGTFGVYAVIALAVNGILLLAIMTAMGSVLTLPGIAGLVLTIGMAIDANVLIYERIREELRVGKTPIAAIDAGFTRAMVTIADSQLTTLVAAFIMFWLGSGPIRGFAVTLTIGIFTSVFTAVTVTRLLVALWLQRARARTRAVDVPI